MKDILAELKTDGLLAHTRKLNPQSTKSVKPTFYSEGIIDEIKKRYSILEKN